MFLPAFANLLTKGRIKYGVTGSVTVRVMVSINIALFMLYFIHLYSVDGATSHYCGALNLRLNILYSAAH